MQGPPQAPDTTEAGSQRPFPSTPQHVHGHGRLLPLEEARAEAVKLPASRQARPCNCGPGAVWPTGSVCRKSLISPLGHFINSCVYTLTLLGRDIHSKGLEQLQHTAEIVQALHLHLKHHIHFSTDGSIKKVFFLQVLNIKKLICSPATENGPRTSQSKCP